MPQTPWYPLHSLRENSKNKYATSLVDQAAKSLCKIWRPRGIPLVFLTSSRVTVGSEQQASLPPKSRRRNTQWPSPHSLPVSCLGPSVAERVRAAHDGADSLLVFIPSTKLVISRTSPRRYSGVSGHPVPNACTLPTSARLPARFVPNPKTLDAIWRTFGRLVAERVRAVHVNPDVPPDRPPRPKTLVSRMLSRGVFVHPLPNACALSTSAPAGRRISPRPKGACTYLGCYLEGVQVFFLTRCRTPPTSRRIGLRPKNTYISGVLKAMATRFGIPAAAHTHADVVGADSPPDRMRHRT
ncbi:hypothetical protein B0H14DRAFT_2649860 [Mycena olivaceomarginata]|nr:hypothetical protein B0H14DRAFT_2649860 [Mycena olivaceomarginata]